jgi:hypothetical protein
MEDAGARPGLGVYGGDAAPDHCMDSLDKFAFNFGKRPNLHAYKNL